MQDPNEDTEWNDALRRHKIIPKKEKEADITEDTIMQMVDTAINEKLTKASGKKMEDMNLDELDEIEDEADEMAWREYRAKRLQQMREEASKGKFGDVLEISAQDYVQEVNRAGEDIFVVLHLYKQGIPLCTIINEHLTLLARKFPETKFIKSISTTCIPNYPDKNLPTMFVYYEGGMKEQFIGPIAFTARPTAEELEWMLSKCGAVKTTLEEDPRPKAQKSTSIFFEGKSKSKRDSDDSSDNDDW